jgi:hypothetical protein
MHSTSGKLLLLSPIHASHPFFAMHYNTSINRGETIDINYTFLSNPKDEVLRLREGERNNMPSVSINPELAQHRSDFRSFDVCDPDRFGRITHGSPAHFTNPLPPVEYQNSFSNFVIFDPEPDSLT